MSPNNDRQPRYQQIAQHYRDQIASGELRDGDRLPSVRDLTEHWHVAHATAAKVISTLVAEGLVSITNRAAGAVVSLKTISSARDRMASIRKHGRIYPTSEYAVIKEAGLQPAPDHVAEALNLDAGAPVIKRRRVTYRRQKDGDVAVSASTSWFDGALADVAPNLLIPERIRLGTPGYIEQQTGRRIQTGSDQVTAAAASADTAEDLRIAESSPVLIARNWFRDEAGEVVEFGEYTSVAGRWQTYEYEM
ncbi:GntR family transcriptional regulator [Actinoplanes subglobosus]|uniref:GntR family transcriptional regulator n=1 Tax=Actinoplanes subglobosus TaxID=1547892 RepID=A0ABV8IWR1_9ACTN